MNKWTLVNKKTLEPIKISIAFMSYEDVNEMFFFTESKNGFFWFVDTKEEVEKALEDCNSYAYNTPQRPFFDDLDKNNYFISNINFS